MSIIQVHSSHSKLFYRSADRSDLDLTLVGYITTVGGEMFYLRLILA